MDLSNITNGRLVKGFQVDMAPNRWGVKKAY